MSANMSDDCCQLLFITITVHFMTFLSIHHLTVSSSLSFYRFCSSNQTADDVRPQQTTWPQFLKTLRPWKSWYSFAPVSVLWSICHVDVLLHPSLFAEDVCGRLLLVCLLWVVVGGCVHALKCCLRPGQNQVSAAAWSGYHLTLCVCLNVICLFSDFASIQGRASTEDTAGSCCWKQE